MLETVTWPIHIKNILKYKRFSFVKTFSGSIRPIVFESVNKLFDCWENLWFTTYTCPHCRKSKTVHFSCKSRFCNSCSKPQSDNWINKLLSRIPRWIGYHHVVLTIPTELRPFFKRHRAALKILPKTASNAITFFCKKSYNGIPWIIAVLHTFWAKLNRNPHVHLLVTHGLIIDDSYFSDTKFFLPCNAVKASRTKWLIKHLKDWCYENLSWDDLIRERHFLNDFYDYRNKDGKPSYRYWFFSEYRIWVSAILWYIWRYVKRPVIAESRILDFDGQNITYSYKDKMDHNISKNITCDANDFIWLLVQHIPDKFFPMVYYYWIFSNRVKKKYLTIINKIRPSNRFTSKSPTKFAGRLALFTWKNPFLCECWSFMLLHIIDIPWYKPKIYPIDFDTS